MKNIKHGMSFAILIIYLFSRGGFLLNINLYLMEKYNMVNPTDKEINILF